MNFQKHKNHFDEFDQRQSRLYTIVDCKTDSYRLSFTDMYNEILRALNDEYLHLKFIKIPLRAIDQLKSKGNVNSDNLVDCLDECNQLKMQLTLHLRQRKQLALVELLSNGQDQKYTNIIDQIVQSLNDEERRENVEKKLIENLVKISVPIVEEKQQPKMENGKLSIFFAELEKLRQECDELKQENIRLSRQIEETRYPSELLKKKTKDEPNNIYLQIKVLEEFIAQLLSENRTLQTIVEHGNQSNEKEIDNKKKIKFGGDCRSIASLSKQVALVARKKFDYSDDDQLSVLSSSNENFEKILEEKYQNYRIESQNNSIPSGIDLNKLQLNGRMSKLNLNALLQLLLKDLHRIVKSVKIRLDGIEDQNERKFLKDILHRIMKIYEKNIHFHETSEQFALSQLTQIKQLQKKLYNRDIILDRTLKRLMFINHERESLLNKII
ncbi:hypothetical protein SNEBB_007032 [Seison nebaliae]|nr:hypothetical protein SNEBB_007032 [Seison nebaliae]